MGYSFWNVQGDRKEMIYEVSKCNEQDEIAKYIESNGGFLDAKTIDYCAGFKFHEFTLEELGLPSADDLLTAVRHIEKDTGIVGWKGTSGNAEHYKGFSLTYNPDYQTLDENKDDKFFQTLGDYSIGNSFSRKGNNITQRKNTYYDTYGFRHVHDLIYQPLQNLFNKVNGAILRSRVAYFYSANTPIPNALGWHKDEPQYHMLRLVIPVKTSPNYVLQIHGPDDEGKMFHMERHLETGKAFIWNNRIAHRVTGLKQCPEDDPRIHIIVGFSPWLNYDKKRDCFVHNENHGRKILDIINSKNFIRG